MIFAFYLIAIFILFFLYKLRRYNLNKINIPTKDVYRENNTKQHLKKTQFIKENTSGALFRDFIYCIRSTLAKWLATGS